MPHDNSAPSSATKKTFEEYRASFWFWVLDRYGLPVMLLFAIAYSGYRFSLWLEPRADQLIDSHIDIVNTAKKIGEESLAVQKENKETNKRTTDILSVMADNTKPLATINSDHLQMTKEIREDVRDISLDVRDIHRSVVPQKIGSTERPIPKPSATAPK